MTATAIRVFVVLFVAAAVPCATAGAQTAPNPRPQQRASLQDPEKTTIDVERLRKLLVEQGAGMKIPFDQPGRSLDPLLLPKFEDRIEVQGKSSLDALVERIVREAVGPPNPWESVSQVMAVERAVAFAIAKAQIAHPANAVNAVRGALYRRKVAKAHREVEAELKALLASQADKTTDPNPPKKQP